MVRLADNSTYVHQDSDHCISFLREQVRYMEQYQLEHDGRYCELEKAVDKLTNGRRAALEETTTLNAIREAHDI